MGDISKKTVAHLEGVLEDAQPGTQRYSAANRAHQALQVLESLEDGEDA